MAGGRRNLAGLGREAVRTEQWNARAIIECCQNSFFIDGLKRIDRLRRLVEYRQTLDRHSAIGRCREHIELLDLLLADKRVEASEFMRRHLSELSTVKPVARQKERVSPSHAAEERDAAE